MQDSSDSDASDIEVEEGMDVDTVPSLSKQIKKKKFNRSTFRDIKKMIKKRLNGVVGSGCKREAKRLLKRQDEMQTRLGAHKQEKREEHKALRAETAETE